MKLRISHNVNATLAAAILGAIPAFALAAPASADLGYARGRILVEPRAGLSDQEFDKILKTHGGKRRKLGQSKLHIVDLPGNLSEADVLDKLARKPHVKYADLDRRVRSTLAVNDPYAGSEWHLPKIGAGNAWDITEGIGITIAILDSGVDTAHPDLQPNLVAGYNLYDNNTNVSDVCGHGTTVAGIAAASGNNGWA